jgi:hypothetical protein
MGAAGERAREEENQRRASTCGRTCLPAIRSDTIRLTCGKETSKLAAEAECAEGETKQAGDPWIGLLFSLHPPPGRRLVTGSCVLRETILRLVPGWSARFGLYLSIQPPPARARTLAYLISLILSLS